MYLTVDDVASRYKVTKDCIWRWVRGDKFPKPVKLNGATRWDIETIQKWENDKNAKTN